MSRPFCHLHVHSHYSLLDGVSTVPSLVRAASDLGMKALALTDHGNMFGAVEFHRECRKAGIKPIIGIEAYISSESRHDKRRDACGNSYYHVILLAQNEAGYRNLIKLSSLAFIEGFYYKPRIDHEILAQHSEGVICTSACLAGEVNRPLIQGDVVAARSAAEKYIKIFGDRFFLEIQDHGLPEQRRVLEQIPSLAKDLGVPLVATNDIHYLTQTDSRAQEIHICCATGSTVEDDERLRFDTDKFHFRSADEMYNTLGDFPEALSNTEEIAALVDFQLDDNGDHLPIYRTGRMAEYVDDTTSPEEIEAQNRVLFRELLEKGFSEKYPEPTEEHRNRLEYEIKIIEEMGFVSYFLITWDFINYARSQGIPVGPGRGSAVGSMVSYCLDITTVCPMKYDLIFERFLNIERVSMPDIDIDFCIVGREKVIEYVRDKYGEDRVCQIITFGTMAAKAVLRDVGRALAIPLKEVDAIAKKVPDQVGIKLRAAIEQEPDLKKFAEDPRYEELFTAALRLEGLNRHCSTHAAGVVVCDQPLTELIPLYRNGDDITSQFTMEVLESLGLLKLDFLGLKTLTILDRAQKIVRTQYEPEFDLNDIPLDDVKTYELLAAGDTKGIFQLESTGMRELLRNMKPDRFEDLIAVLALYRPGPLGSGMDKKFCDRKHGREEMDYPDDRLDAILGESFGVILYQEQVMRIAHDLAGFSMNEADSLRKAMGKKKPEIIAKFKAKFTEGAESRGMDRKVAAEIFEQIEHFAKYGFNKSHSTAYAVVSYQTAYMKANYPAAFLAGVLSCELATVDKMVEYIEEAKLLDIKVHGPTVNSSDLNFTVRDGEIHYGLMAIKGVGERAAQGIIDEREKGGPYRNIYDLAGRVDLKLVTKTTLEQLVRAGAFDRPDGHPRSQNYAVIKDAVDEGQRVQAERRAGQLSLFGDGNSRIAEPEENFPELMEWSESEMLGHEKESLGFYMSGHPIDHYERDMARWRTHAVEAISTAGEGSEVILGVLIAKVRTRVTKRGDTMAFIEVEDRTGKIEIVVFPKTFAEHRERFKDDALVIVRGSVEERDERKQVRLEEIIPLEEACKRFGKRVGIDLELSATSENELFQIKDVVTRHRGALPLSLVFRNDRGHRWIVRASDDMTIEPSVEFFEDLGQVVGADAVRVER